MKSCEYISGISLYNYVESGMKFCGEVVETNSVETFMHSEELLKFQSVQEVENFN